MPSRESLFEFAFPRDGAEARIVVRAWSADEAQASIRQVLEAAGIANPDGLVARPLRQPPSARNNRGIAPSRPADLGELAAE